jgi:hypothetical protein
MTFHDFVLNIFAHHAAVHEDYSIEQLYDYAERAWEHTCQKDIQNLLDHGEWYENGDGGHNLNLPQSYCIILDFDLTTEKWSVQLSPPSHTDYSFGTVIKGIVPHNESTESEMVAKSEAIHKVMDFIHQNIGLL